MQDTGCLGLVHWDDPEGWYREGGGMGVQDWEHVYTRGRFMLVSDEVGPEPSVLPSRETGVWGTFGGCMKGVRYHFALQDRTWDFP